MDYFETYTLHLSLSESTSSQCPQLSIFWCSLSLSAPLPLHTFLGSAYLVILCLHRQKLHSLQRNQIFTSPLQDFSNFALGKNPPPKWNMRGLHQYAHASCAHIHNLCLLGKTFNFAKPFPSLCSVLIPKRVPNHPAEGASPRERPQTPLQTHQKASPARPRTDYPWRIATIDPQRADYH